MNEPWRSIGKEETSPLGGQTVAQAGCRNGADATEVGGHFPFLLGLLQAGEVAGGRSQLTKRSASRLVGSLD
jgi:hypothetical protein